MLKIDITRCHCGDRLKIIVCMEDEVTIQRVLDHLDRQPQSAAGNTARPVDQATRPVMPRTKAEAGVNDDLKYNGYDNLFVCDLSVFPTSPATNPSLTLAALSLRLADHLKALL